MLLSLLGEKGSGRRDESRRALAQVLLIQEVWNFMFSTVCSSVARNLCSLILPGSLHHASA